MTILLTTSNFPDVMLPAYNASRVNCVFFILYLVFGLYFLLNVLLAIVFDNYKKRLDNVVTEKQNIRLKYINDFYSKIDTDEKGYLTLDEMKEFFQIVIPLNYEK
jgi:two pore calcium channel protein